jgi:hypothetical protein
MGERRDVHSDHGCADLPNIDALCTVEHTEGGHRMYVVFVRLQSSRRDGISMFGGSVGDDGKLAAVLVF